MHGEGGRDVGAPRGFGEALHRSLPSFYLAAAGAAQYGRAVRGHAQSFPSISIWSRLAEAIRALDDHRYTQRLWRRGVAAV